MFSPVLHLNVSHLSVCCSCCRIIHSTSSVSLDLSRMRSLKLTAKHTFCPRVGMWPVMLVRQTCVSGSFLRSLCPAYNCVAIFVRTSCGVGVGAKGFGTRGDREMGDWRAEGLRAKERGILPDCKCECTQHMSLFFPEWHTYAFSAHRLLHQPQEWTVLTGS